MLFDRSGYASELKEFMVHLFFSSIIMLSFINVCAQE